MNKRIIRLLITLLLAVSLAFVPSISGFSYADVSFGDNTSADEYDEEAEEESDDDYIAISKDEAVELVAYALRNHKREVEFISADTLMTDKDAFQYLDEVFNLATNGIMDYYLFSVLSICESTVETESIVGSEEKIGALGFHFEYMTTKKQDEAFEKELKRVMKSLNLNGKSKKAKAKAIYKWITKNVKYGNCGKELHYTAYSAHVKRKAVCQGVTALYYRMLREAGVEANIISGKGYGEPHGWVLVKIGSKWYNTDPTWDLGGKKYHYLFKTDKYFTKTHHKRDKEYRSKEFIKDHPMGKKNL